jgi:hypothetical protein
VELGLNSQAPGCPTELKALVGKIAQYEQEAIAYNPHVSAGQ